MGKITNYTLFLLLFFSIQITRAQDVSATERQALIEFYTAADGPNWYINSNWNTSALVSTWHGVTVLDGKVIGLELHNNDLRGSISPSIGNLTELKSLYLSGSNFEGTTFPNEIENLSNLETLRLSDCLVGGEIPTGLALAEDQIREVRLDATGRAIIAAQLQCNHHSKKRKREDTNLTSIRFVLLNKTANTVVETSPAATLISAGYKKENSGNWGAQNSIFPDSF